MFTAHSSFHTYFPSFASGIQNDWGVLPSLTHGFQDCQGEEYVGTSPGDFCGPGLEEECGGQDAKALSVPPSHIAPLL